jgi:hypothetical protein
MRCRVNLSWKVHHLKGFSYFCDLYQIFPGFLDVGSLLARHKKQVMSVPHTTTSTIESAVIALFLFVALTIDGHINHPSTHPLTIHLPSIEPSIYNQSTKRWTIDQPSIYHQSSHRPTIDQPSIDHRSIGSIIARPSIDPSTDHQSTHQ